MSEKKLIIAPSILAAKWGSFAEEIRTVSNQGADWIHIDVMDGHFVPPITFGPDIVRAARMVTTLPLDVHLMIEQPERQLEAFAQAGANVLTVHVEACPHLHRTVQSIHQLGVKAGVAINPGTPVASLAAILDDVDLVLIMSVNPGWSGQTFIKGALKKIEDVAAMIKKTGKEIHLEVDGGITAETKSEVLRAGANVLVAGTYVFHHQNYAEAIAALRS